MGVAAAIEQPGRPGPIGLEAAGGAVERADSLNRTLRTRIVGGVAPGARKPRLPD